jgi:hypothetical protein
VIVLCNAILKRLRHVLINHHSIIPSHHRNVYNRDDTSNPKMTGTIPTLIGEFTALQSMLV